MPRQSLSQGRPRHTISRNEGERRLARSSTKHGLTVAGLFAGIGGIEEGLHAAGHTTRLLCEVEPSAVTVLRSRFAGTEIAGDIAKIKRLPRVDVVAAGFPCQDLSQAGRTAGIRGRQSGLVGHVFRLLDEFGSGPRWLLLENVSFMLHLDRGKAMRYLVGELERRRFRWAYRIVDTRAFGLPQRRQRVILVASKSEDPRAVLFSDDAVPNEPAYSPDRWCGFYWTEGVRGLGWAVDGVPTLKGGSTIGIASPPAIWIPSTGEFGTPDIRDAERLQGFPVDWTLPAASLPGAKRGQRWKLVGNAVSVPVAEWVGRRLANPGTAPTLSGTPLRSGSPWPRAAWGQDGRVYAVPVSMWPVARPAPSLAQFLQFPLAPLSLRAAQGFMNRMEISSLKFEPAFRLAIAKYVASGATRAVA